MPTRAIDLSDEEDKFILERVESGRYKDPTEVIPAALRALENDEKLTALRAAIDEGDTSGIYEGDPFEDALAEIDRMDAKP